MTTPGKVFGYEPVAILEVVKAAVTLAVGFGLDLSIEQTAAVYVLVAAILTVLARSQVTPVARKEQS